MGTEKREGNDQPDEKKISNEKESEINVKDQNKQTEKTPEIESDNGEMINKEETVKEAVKEVCKENNKPKEEESNTEEVLEMSVENVDKDDKQAEKESNNGGLVSEQETTEKTSEENVHIEMERVKEDIPTQEDDIIIEKKMDAEKVSEDNNENDDPKESDNVGIVIDENTVEAHQEIDV